MRIFVFVVFSSILKGFAVQLASKLLFKIKPDLKYLTLLILCIFTVSSILIFTFNFLTGISVFSLKGNGSISFITFFLVQVIIFAQYLRYPLGDNIKGLALLKLIALSVLIEGLLYIPLAIVLMLLFGIFGSNA